MSWIFDVSQESDESEGTPGYPCDICQPTKTFSRQEHLRRHLLNHKTPEFLCEIPGCDNAFHRPDLLARHMVIHEPGNTAKPFFRYPARTSTLGSSSNSEERSEPTSDSEEKKEPHTYSTLSRDQTSASGYEIEILQVLRQVTSASSNEDDIEPTPKVIDWIREDEAKLSIPATNISNGTYSIQDTGSTKDNLRLQIPPKQVASATYTPAPLEIMAAQSIDGGLDEAIESTWPLRGLKESLDDGGYLNHLRTQIEYLEKELQRQSNDVAPGQTEMKGGPTFETLYIIERSNADINSIKEIRDRAYPKSFSSDLSARQTIPKMAYLDEPTWLVGPDQQFMLRANFPITDFDGYLGQRGKAAFVIVKIYTPHQQASELQRADREKRALPRPKPSHEYIRLMSEDMIASVKDFFGRQPKFDTDFPNFNIRNPIASPYLCWYFYRSDDAFSGMHPNHRKHMKLLTGEMEKSCKDMYRKVNSQIKRQVVSFQTIQFLFRPGDVLLSKDDKKQEAFIALGYAIQRQDQRKPPRRLKDWVGQDDDDYIPRNYTWNIDAWSYQYDGHFYKRECTGVSSINLDLHVSHYEEEVPLSNLNLLPLAYADKAFAERLAKRGEIFWSCRHKKLVSYHERLDQFASGTGDRFMVDFLTYRQLHSDSPGFKTKYSSRNPPSHNYMDDVTMRNDTPPPAPEIYLFPDTIPGFNLRTKKWVDLEVDRIQGVKWNKKAFEDLVIDLETKELIQALVTNQSEADHDADLIESKGNGLIMLLHGGPGTGKTFTAETVAEIAEKPLFRVTCGDIGTKPENVEKYLESALNLGKIWKCVVLLDEADVFLEQRTLTDLERNALVSVFLRVLEYYEGIMILTSNRVGTFDEAFKSRIQLSLHYENLKKSQRRQIWKNFLDRLSNLQKERASSTPSLITQPNSLSKKEDFGIDFDDINDYLKELSNYDLNGRQIRNAITTARQLAKFKKEIMSYAHLKHVIDVASKFDTYLDNLTGFSGDDIARENGIR